jgi:hypothetical protein
MLQDSVSWSFRSITACLLACAVCYGDVLASPAYEIDVLGLTDAEHTRSDGYQYSYLGWLNNNGQVLGFSTRYHGSSQVGTSTWLYDHGVMIRLGLTDAGHTGSDGYQFTFAAGLNNTGRVVGYSDRFSGSDYTGRSAWIYEEGITTQIGLTGGEYTRGDGYQESSVLLLNEAGQVVGTSGRYQGTSDMGFSTWLYDRGVITRLGFYDAQHTSESGYQETRSEAMSEAGHVIGYSMRYDGSPGGKTSAWEFFQGTTTRLGLSDAEHTDAGGGISSYAVAVNDAGQVAGSSARFAGNEYMGSSAWVYSQGVTARVGLIGPSYTRSDGYQYSDVKTVNSAGHVIGYSRCSNSTEMGYASWLHTGGTTTRIGLVDSEHTRSDGYQYSEAAVVNSSDQVIGFSDRYEGMTNRGCSAWIFDDGVTTQLGLADARHTKGGGDRNSKPSYLNEAGQVVGISQRFSGDNRRGYSGWFFDDDLNQTFSLVFSMRSDGYANTAPWFLSEDGLVLGGYNLFAADDTDLGMHAFAWSVTDGFREIGLLVDGGLSDNGWRQLYAAMTMNDLGYIAGTGLAVSQTGGQLVFLMTPVPEPSTFLLLLTAFAVVAFCRREWVSAPTTDAPLT